MKNFFIVCFVLNSIISFSQTKTAHINYSKLVLSMPETKKADSTLDVLTKSYQRELTKLEAEYKIKTESFQKDEKTMPQAMKELRMKELKDAEASYAKFQEAAKKDIASKDKELFDIIFEKAKKAVTDVAISKGYDYVIDSSKDQYVYMNPKDDLMELVKKKMAL